MIATIDMRTCFIIYVLDPSPLDRVSVTRRPRLGTRNLEPRPRTLLAFPARTGTMARAGWDFKKDLGKKREFPPVWSNQNGGDSGIVWTAHPLSYAGRLSESFALQDIKNTCL